MDQQILENGFSEKQKERIATLKKGFLLSVVFLSAFIFYIDFNNNNLSFDSFLLILTVQAVSFGSFALLIYVNFLSLVKPLQKIILYIADSLFFAITLSLILSRLSIFNEGVGFLFAASFLSWLLFNIFGIGGVDYNLGISRFNKEKNKA